MGSLIRPVRVFVLRVWHEPGSGEGAWRGVVRSLHSRADAREVPFRDLEHLAQVVRLMLEEGEEPDSNL